MLLPGSEAIPSGMVFCDSSALHSAAGAAEAAGAGSRDQSSDLIYSTEADQVLAVQAPLRPGDIITV